MVIKTNQSSQKETTCDGYVPMGSALSKPIETNKTSFAYNFNSYWDICDGVFFFFLDALCLYFFSG